MEPLDYAKGDRRTRGRVPLKSDCYDPVYEWGPILQTLPVVAIIAFLVAWAYLQ